MSTVLLFHFFFFFNDTATTEIYTLSLHDALPILRRQLPLAYPMARTSTITTPGGSPVRANRPAESVVVVRRVPIIWTVAPAMGARVSPAMTCPVSAAESPGVDAAWAARSGATPQSPI